MDVEQINITEQSIHWGDLELIDLLLKEKTQRKNNYNVCITLLIYIVIVISLSNKSIIITLSHLIKIKNEKKTI